LHAHGDLELVSADLKVDPPLPAVWRTLEAGQLDGTELDLVSSAPVVTCHDAL
jgi:hypothetical protein